MTPLVSMSIDQLRDEVQRLRDELRLGKDFAVMAAFSLHWKLSNTESSLLAALYAANGAVCSRPFLMEVLYGGSADEPEIKIINVFASKIRTKTKAHFIHTRWGVGYYLDQDGMAQCRAVIEGAAA